jgi:Glycosyltransferase Family 4
VTRVALLDGARQHYVARLAASLRDAGVDVRQRASHPAAAAAEALLARRGFTPGLADVPVALAWLRRGDFDAAHAFTATDAVAALAWRRNVRKPVVFTCTETLDRGSVANARLRLASLERAVSETDAVLAADDDVAAALWRWFAVEAPVLESAGLARLYGELAASRG